MREFRKSHQNYVAYIRVNTVAITPRLLELPISRSDVQLVGKMFPKYSCSFSTFKFYFSCLFKFQNRIEQTMPRE